MLPGQCSRQSFAGKSFVADSARQATDFHICRIVEKSRRTFGRFSAIRSSYRSRNDMAEPANCKGLEHHEILVPLDRILSRDMSRSCLLVSSHPVPTRSVTDRIGDQPRWCVPRPVLRFLASMSDANYSHRVVAGAVPNWGSANSFDNLGSWRAESISGGQRPRRLASSA